MCCYLQNPSIHKHLIDNMFASVCIIFKSSENKSSGNMFLMDSYLLSQVTWTVSLFPNVCISRTVFNFLVYFDIWPTFSLISSALLHRGSASLYFPLFPYRTARLLRVAATWKGHTHTHTLLFFKLEDEPKSSSTIYSISCVCVYVCLCVRERPQDSTTAAHCHWSGEWVNVEEEEDERKQEVILVSCNLIKISCVMNLQHVHSEGARLQSRPGVRSDLWFKPHSGGHVDRVGGKGGRACVEEGELI